MRYQGNIDVIGGGGQKKLQKSTVLIAGAGGLGGFVSVELALMGIGEIILVDRDTVEDSNLNRQVLYRETDIGKKKIPVAVERLKELNPYIEIVGIDDDIENVDEEADVYIDCLDNWDGRHALVKLAKKYGKPVVHGAVDSFKGQVGLFVSNHDWLLRIKGKNVRGNISPVVATIASLESSICMNYLLGKLNEDFLILIDLEKYEFRKIRIK